VTSIEGDAAPAAPSAPVPSDADRVPPPPERWPRWLDGVALAAVVAAGLVLRFVTKSPLWFDEALSVNIARLPVGDIPEALRQDGHPPLYYVVLHGWMEVFGEGDVAVRALSGVFGVALLPLMWIAGRRLGGRRAAVAALALTSLSPYVIRYSTETRMYAMAMVLAAGAWLVADDALKRPTGVRLVGLALLTGILLLTHYWAMWLLGAAGVALLWRLWRTHRAGQTVERRHTLAVLGALVGGSLLFLPWVPSLIYQSNRTGTPWALPVRPTLVVTTSLAGLGGGPGEGEAVLLGMALLVLLLLALFGRAVGHNRIELDLAIRPEARRPTVLVVLTLAIAVAMGYASASTFATRYLAVLVPFILALAALGASRFSGGLAFRLVLAGALTLGLIGGLRNVVTERTQAGQLADAIEVRATGDDLVVTCPDQLGPAMDRALSDDIDIVTYPRFESPKRIDWVDYEQRTNAVAPRAFATDLLSRAEGRQVWIVSAGGYRTHPRACERLVEAMYQARPWGRVIREEGSFFEWASAARFPAEPPPRD
jgi:hypothetical protein